MLILRSALQPSSRYRCKVGAIAATSFFIVGKVLTIAYCALFQRNDTSWHKLQTILSTEEWWSTLR